MFLIFSRPAVGRPRPKIYAYTRSVYFQSLLCGFASKFDFRNRSRYFQPLLCGLASKFDFRNRSRYIQPLLCKLASKFDFLNRCRCIQPLLCRPASKLNFLIVADIFLHFCADLHQKRTLVIEAGLLAGREASGSARPLSYYNCLFFE